MSNEVKNDSEQSIRLDDIVYIILKHHKTILGIGIIGLLVGILISFAFYVKGLATVEYYVTASIAVTSTNENGLFSANSSDPNAADIHLAEDMTDAVIYVCKSDTTLNAAAERLQLIGVRAEDIKPKLMLSQYEQTQIIEMTLIWDNAEEGMMILNAITDVVPDILISTLKLGDVTVVNPPKVTTSSLSFINVKIVAICFLAGLVICCGFYILKYFLHPTYLHSEDVMNEYGVEIIGEIPKDKNYFSAKINSLSANEFSTVQEYFSACGHVLVYRLQELDHACVYITSSAAKEGKTSITANLAYALSDLGYKTLLMDMDIRNPSLSSKFIMNKDDKHSLNAIYRDEVSIEEAIVNINTNLDIIPTRLEDDALRIDMKVVEIISSAKEEYDFVLLDTAPIGQVSDSMSLNQAADCAIFVIRQDQVWINTVTESMNRLKKSGIDLLGIIMNDTKGGSSTYYSRNARQFGDSPYVHRKKPVVEKTEKASKNKKKNEEEIKEETTKEEVSEEILENETVENEVTENEMEVTETADVKEEVKEEPEEKKDVVDETDDKDKADNE